MANSLYIRPCCYTCVEFKMIGLIMVAEIDSKINDKKYLIGVENFTIEFANKNTLKTIDNELIY